MSKAERRPVRAAKKQRLRYSRLPVFEGADLAVRRLALMEARSGRPGPTVWLTAGIHGDEVGGIVVVHEIFRRLRRRPLVRGRLAAFPLLNPFGFDAASRHIPSTQEDLNRAFPGDPEGTLAERIAHLVRSRVCADAPALVLDLHNDWLRSIPYALIDPRPASQSGREAHRRAREAAAATDLPIVDEQAEGVSRAMLRSTLSGNLIERGVPSLTFELGAAHVVDEDNVQTGLGAVWSVLARLGLVEADPHERPGAPLSATPAAYRRRLLRYDHHPIPSRSGIARFRVAPGEVVSQGRVVASIHDVFGRAVEQLVAPREALVLGYADSSLAVPGMPLLAMAIRGSARD